MTDLHDGKMDKGNKLAVIIMFLVLVAALIAYQLTT